MFKIDINEFISKQKFITYLSNYKKDMLEYITVFKDKPDYLLVLCWNIADEIIKQLKNYHDAGGKFIIPIPKIEII